MRPRRSRSACGDRPAHQRLSVGAVGVVRSLNKADSRAESKRSAQRLPKHMGRQRCLRVVGKGRAPIVQTDGLMRIYPNGHVDGESTVAQFGRE
eukprot:scaffold128380_cov38-Tisochrysis_lutea.AAC.2